MSFHATAINAFKLHCANAVIDRKSLIDASTTHGHRPTNVPEGRVELRDVKFAYPTRADVPVFTRLNLAVPAGLVTALVGESGGGKSTIVSLLERFYDVQSGVFLVALGVFHILPQC